MCRTEYDTDMTPEDSVKQIIILAEHFLLLIITCICMAYIVLTALAAFLCTTRLWFARPDSSLIATTTSVSSNTQEKCLQSARLEH